MTTPMTLHGKLVTELTDTQVLVAQRSTRRPWGRPMGILIESIAPAKRGDFVRVWNQADDKEFLARAGEILEQKAHRLGHSGRFYETLCVLERVLP